MARGASRHIAESLREQIQNGDLRGGMTVPSEMELADRFGVARGTVRTALAALTEEGLIAVVAGKGRVVVGAAPLAASAYEKISRDLAQRIRAGEFELVKPLPSEAEVMAEYGVSRNTARRAYQHLVEHGLVVIRQGAGAFVAPR